MGRNTWRDADWDRLVAWLLVAPYFVAALAVNYYPWAPSNEYALPMAGLALCALFALGALAFRRGLASRVLANGRAFWVPIAALLVVLTISTAISGNAAEEFFGTDTSRGLVQLAALTLLGVCAMGLPGQVRRVLLTIAPPVMLVEVAVTLWSLAHGQEGRGTLENTVYLAQLVLLLLPFLMLPWSAEHPRRALDAVRTGLAWAGVLVLGLAGSRVGLVLGIVVLLVLTVVRATPKRASVFNVHVHGKWPLWTALGVGFLAVAAFVGPWRYKFTSELSGDWLFSFRAEYWRAAWQSFMTSPLVGRGPDSYWFEVTRLGRRGIVGLDAVSGDPHNVVLTVLQVGGVLGMAALAWIAVAGWRNWRGQGRNAIWLAAGLFAFVLTGLFEPLPLQVIPLFALVFGASLAPADAHTPAETPAEPLARRAAGIGVLAVTGALSVYLVVLSAAVLASVLPPQIDARVAGRAQAAADVVHFDAFLYSTASTAWWYAAQGQPAAGFQGKAVSAMERANALAPQIPLYAIQLARLYADYQRPYPVVQAAFVRALSLQPDDNGALTDYARYLLASGQTSAARDEVRHLLSVGGTVAVPADLAPLVGSTPATSAP